MEQRIDLKKDLTFSDRLETANKYDNFKVFLNLSITVQIRSQSFPEPSHSKLTIFLSLARDFIRAFFHSYLLFLSPLSILSNTVKL